MNKIKRVRPKKFTCRQVRDFIDNYFANNDRQGVNEDKMNEALNKHLTDHSWNQEFIGKRHHVCCQNCWIHYQEMKKEYCGG